MNTCPWLLRPVSINHRESASKAGFRPIVKPYEPIGWGDLGFRRFFKEILSPKIERGAPPPEAPRVEIRLTRTLNPIFRDARSVGWFPRKSLLSINSAGFFSEFRLGVATDGFGVDLSESSGLVFSKMRGGCTELIQIALDGLANRATRRG